MINLLEIQEKENQGLLDVRSVNNKIEQLPENRGHYYITRNGKRRYDISQEALFENLLKYSYNSFRKMGIGSSFELQSPTGGARIGELSMLATPEGREELEKRTKALSEQLQSQTSFYREEVKRYRDLLNSEVERDPSLTQRLPTGMIVNMTRQIVDPSQWALLAATSWIGGAAGGKVAGVLGSKIAPATAKRIGAFVGRAVGEGIEEAIDEYSVDGEISAEGVISAGLGGGVIGEVPYLAKSLAGKLNLTKKAGKVAGDIKTEVAEKPLMQKLKDDYNEKVSKKRSSNRVDVDNMAEIAEATEIQGEMKGKVISAKETFEKSILIEGVTTEQAANEYLPKIAKHIIDNKLLKDVVDENSFFEAIISNGKAVKNVFRNLGRRKDLPEDLKTAIEWYNKVMDETRIKSIEVDPNKAVDNSIGVLEKPSEYKPIWRVPEEQMGHQADPVLHERDIYFSRIGKYAVDNQLIKGVDTVEKFLEGVKNNSRAVRKFFRNVDRRKDLPDDVKEALEWYRKPEFEEAQKIELENRAESKADSKAEPENQNTVPDVQDIKTEKTWNNFRDSVPDRMPDNAPGGETVGYKMESVQIEEQYPFTLSEISGTKFEEVKKERIVHNPRDYSKKQLEIELRKDLKIPKKAKVIKVNGNVPKTKVPIITGKDYDGNSVTGRSKWIRHIPEADIEWEYEGNKYYAKVNIIDDKWRGDIYKFNPKKEVRIDKSPDVVKQAEKIETPENILEEIHGQYKPSKKELENFKIFKERLYKFLGIDKLNLEVSPKEQVELQRKIARTFGSFVKKIHNFKNIDEMIDYYKTKKGIDFELEIIPQKLGMLGETKLYSTVEGNKVKIVLTQETMQDTDLAMGILRHEIEHATDFIKKPDFDGRPYHWLTPEKDMTVADYFNASTGGHFSSDNNSMYELNYIAANMMNNMVYEGKLNKEVVKRLGFDMIPENPTDLELKMIETAVKEGAKETDALKRLAKLEKDLSVAFTTKRGLLEIAKMKTSVSNKSALMKAYIKTNILLPFERVENQMYNKIVKAFEIEYKGTKYNVPEIMNLFEMNNGDFVNWCFYWDKLPDELMDMGPQLQGLKATLLQIVDNIAEGTGATRMDIINTLNFDRNFTIESLIPEEDIPKFLKPDGTLDTDKLFSDTQITDKVTGKIVSERFAMYRDRFAEMNYGFFNSAKEVLIHELSRAEIDPKRVINVLIEARDCMKLDEYTNLLRKYQVEKIPEINDYLLKHQDLFQEKATLFGITPEDGIEKAIIESKKKNAKLFFMQDMESIKGTNRNPVLGGHLHRLGRFTHFVDEGLISKSNVSNFVKTNHVDSRLMMYKFLKDIPSSYAIKDTMPAGGWNGFKEVLNQVSHSIVDENKKTYLKDVEGYVKNEIGEKLGQITYPPRGTLDKVVSHILSGLNRVNLMGPKFLKELLQEPLGISENKIMLYGGQGFVDTYGDMLKATAILIENGERLRKINEVLGDRFHKSVSTEAFNIIRKDLDDVTGYFAKRRAKYGTKGEKIIHALTTGTEAMNWYSYSQTMMKLSSNLGAGHIIETWTKFSSLENLFSENTHYVKRIIRELEIDDVDFALLKKFSETNTFKELGIFDEVQFKNSLTPDDFSKLLGREITPDEFNLLRDATVKKVSKLNDKIANDISPTETTGGAKTEIESIKDPVLRNFVKLIGDFKSSIQEIWRRKLNAYYLSNIDPDTGKFDFSNKIYRKRILKNIFDKGAFIAALATVSNAEFYEDPQEYISEKIDELISNPVSPLWAAAQEDLNLWGLTTGANALTQPMAVMNNATKGKWDKAGKALIKMGIGKSNYDIGEKAYKYLFDD